MPFWARRGSRLTRNETAAALPVAGSATPHQRYATVNPRLNFFQWPARPGAVLRSVQFLVRSPELPVIGADAAAGRSLGPDSPTFRTPHEADLQSDPNSGIGVAESSRVPIGAIQRLDPVFCAPSSTEWTAAIPSAIGVPCAGGPRSGRGHTKISLVSARVSSSGSRFVN